VTFVGAYDLKQLVQVRLVPTTMEQAKPRLRYAKTLTLT